MGFETSFEQVCGAARRLASNIPHACVAAGSSSRRAHDKPGQQQERGEIGAVGHCPKGSRRGDNYGVDGRTGEAGIGNAFKRQDGDLHDHDAATERVHGGG